MAISTLIRLRAGEAIASTLAFVAAVSLQETIASYGVEAMIKWPNDLLIDGAKLSGILLERVDDAVVVGFGVNLAHHPAGLDRPTTSLAAHDVHVDAQQFAKVLAEMFARWVGIWREGVGPVLDRWTEKAHPIGTPLTARLADGTTHGGVFGGLSADGALMLRLADGSSRAIHAGDVFLL